MCSNIKTIILKKEIDIYSNIFNNTPIISLYYSCCVKFFIIPLSKAAF